MSNIFQDMLEQSALVNRMQEDFRNEPYPKDGSSENKRAWLVGNILAAIQGLRDSKFKGLGIKNADFLDSLTALLALQYVSSLVPGAPVDIVAKVACAHLTAYMGEMNQVKIIIDKFWDDENGGKEE